MHLANNQELYNYLVRLAQYLKERDAIQLSDVVTRASRQASSLSSDFLGESRIALRRVLSEGTDVLEASERVDVDDVLRQLTAAIDR